MAASAALVATAPFLAGPALAASESMSLRLWCSRAAPSTLHLFELHSYSTIMIHLFGLACKNM